MKLTYRRDYGKEAFRARDTHPFEWHTAIWWVVGVHVHNRTENGMWHVSFTGYINRKLKATFATKEQAMEAAEKHIDSIVQTWRQS